MAKRDPKIGDIVTITFPFYDVKKDERSFKQRPCMILSNIRNNDFNVLPISRISKSEYIDSDYDIYIDITKYPKLNLSASSYVRVHKQTTANICDIHKICSNIKDSYEDLYLEIIGLWEIYTKQLLSDTL